jgi:hypothetical protein
MIFTTQFVLGCIIGIALVNSHCRKCQRYQRFLEDQFKINKELLDKLEQNMDRKNDA